MMTGSTKWQMVLVATLFAGQFGCNADATTAPGTAGRRVEALSPTTITGIVGGVSLVEPAIRVMDTRTGKPEANVPVLFFPSVGSVATNSTVTDSAGIASAGEWRFPQRPGLSLLRVSVGGAQTITFFATVKPDVPDHFTVLWGQDQAAIASQTVGSLAFYVEDRFRNPLPFVEVTFRVVDGGGTLEPHKVTTDASGFVLATGWRLGPTPAENRVSTSVSGIDSVLFRAQGLDSAEIKWYKLEVLRNGSVETKPEAAGIVDARMGLTRFDKCLCGVQRGHFLRTGLSIAGASGPYVLREAELFSPQGWTSAVIDGDLLVLQAPDPWDGEWTMTWIYREIKESGP